ncbi:MAG: AEC family transporter [Clostridia bacterium]|nr:AEC family transporter [Clostridia bacterium]
MLSNLTYSVNAVVPIFILVILGYLLKRFRFITDDFCEVAERVVFKIALPVMLFLEVSKSSLDVIGDMRLIWFCVITVTASFALVTLFAAVCFRDPTKRGAFVQGMCRSNFAILGVPLAENMFGTTGTQMIAIVMPFVILMFNSYSVIILSVFSSDAEHKLNKKSILGILKNIVTNPLIIGVVLGLPFMFFGWELPVIANKSLTYLNNLCTPLALMSLGANFKPANMKGRMGYAVASSLGKTVLLPGLMVTLAALLGFRDASLGVVLILFGAPTAVSSYIMAKKMKNDGELAAQILLLTTLLCIVTIFIGIFILKTLALI